MCNFFRTNIGAFKTPKFILPNPYSLILTSQLLLFNSYLLIALHKLPHNQRGNS
jgi:hypothetical protein